MIKYIRFFACVHHQAQVQSYPIGNKAGLGILSPFQYKTCTFQKGKMWNSTCSECCYSPDLIPNNSFWDLFCLEMLRGQKIGMSALMNSTKKKK